MNNEIIVIEPEETEEIVVIENDIKILKPNTQEKEVNPEKYKQQITPDENYTGLSKVIVNAVSSDIDTNIKPENIKKDIEILGVRGEVDPLNGITTEITSNGIYKPEKPYNGFTEVSVKTSGVDINDYFYEDFKLIGGGNSNASNIKQIIKTVEISQVGSNNLGYAFYGTNIEKIIFKETIDTSNVTNMSSMFTYVRSLKEITGLENLNTSNVTNMGSMFEFVALPEIDISMWDTSNVNSIYNMFARTEAKIINISGLSFKKVTNMQNLFNGSKVETIIGFDGTSTSNVENMSWAFYCTNLKNLPQINCESANNISNMLQWSGNMALTSIGGLLNLGKGYDTTKPENFSNYSLKLDYCPLLTHDSLMNVINGLYDIASKGVKPQQLVLGSTNLSKLTADEIAIATNKGWTVS